MTDDLDFYDLLGVGEDASTEEIRNQFRRQVRQYHPDLNDDPRAPAQFTALKKAYDTLADESERNTYDRLGHEEYIRKRISRLPSPEDWEIPEQEHDHEDGDSDSDENASSERHADPDAAERQASEAGADGSGNGTADASTGSDRVDEPAPGSFGVREPRTSTGGGSVSANRTRSAELGRTTPGEGGLGREAIRRSKGGGPGGAGTARDPDQVWTPDGWNENETEDEDANTTSTDLASLLDGVYGIRTQVESTLSATLGWPLIVAADVLYLASIGLYLADSATAVEQLVSQIQRVGADPFALGAVLGTRPAGLSSLTEFIVSAFARSSPFLGAGVLVAIAFLPTVYFFMVRWTRNNNLPWQPSYLYVTGALAPILGVALSVSVSTPGVFVEVLFYFLVPVTTICAMLFFGQIKPHAVRLYRRWRYRWQS
jgi:curved DNA-binding protein CbpA